MFAEGKDRWDRLVSLLGITYPIIQGAMGNISKHELAAAVSLAGGLGTIAGGGLDPEELREEIHGIRQITDKSFAVNVPMKHPAVDAMIQVVIEERVPVLVTGAGNPEKYIPAVKAAEIKIVPVVAFTALAKRLSRFGADAFIAEGCESGGHIGDITTMCLVPQIADVVTVPVIAAGGIADGRGMAAAFMLGASGVQLGTAFLVAKECTVHNNYKQMVLKAKDISTTVLNHTRIDLDNIRALRNTLTNKYLATENINVMNLEGCLRQAAAIGDKDSGLFMAGQIAGLLKQEKCVKEIIEEIMQQASYQLER